MSTTATQCAQMFSGEAWDAGWAKAQTLGLAEVWAPRSRPVTRRDVEEIVSAVANHGFEELYVDQALPDHVFESPEPGMLERLREHMKDVIASKAIRAGCVMLTLPREVIDHPERFMTRIRLIVPVRRLTESAELATPSRP